MRHQFDQEFVDRLERDDGDVRARPPPPGTRSWRRPCRRVPADRLSRAAASLPWGPWLSAWALVTLASLGRARLRLRRLPARPPSAGGAAMSGPHRAAGPRHRRRPQRPGGLRGAALGAAAAGRVARRGSGRRRRRRPPVRPVDPVQPRRPRVPRLRVAHLAAHRRRRDHRPRRAGVRLLAARAGRTTSNCWSPAPTAWSRSTSAPARTTTSWELTHRRAGPHPRRPRRDPRRPALRDRRRRADVRDRPCRRPTNRCGH